jgi:hypothetical protein
VEKVNRFGNAMKPASVSPSGWTAPCSLPLPGPNGQQPNRPHHLFPPALLHAGLTSALLLLPPDGKRSRCLLVREHACCFLHLLLNPNHLDGPPLRAPLPVPATRCCAVVLSLLADILSDLAEVSGFFWPPCVCLGDQKRGSSLAGPKQSVGAAGRC